MRVVDMTNKIIYDSSREAERATSIDHSNIIKCCKGIRNTVGGIKWQYHDFLNEDMTDFKYYYNGELI